MKLVDWAKSQGISYRTAYNWFKAGKLPVKSIQTVTGMILLDPDTVNVVRQLDNKKDI